MEATIKKELESITRRIKVMSKEIEFLKKNTDLSKKEFLRADEACLFLNVGLSTIWLFVKQNKIKSYKISERVTLFKTCELREFIESFEEENK